MNLDAILHILNSPWWYTWKYDQLDRPGYTPMVWRCTKDWIERALPLALEEPERMWLLGNEPERLDQSNTPPDEFADNARRWALAGLPFAAPGVLWNEQGRKWLEEYLSAGGPEPDAWHFHIYAWSAGHFLAEIASMNRMWSRRPIIISECAGAVDNANLDVMRGVKEALRTGRIQAAAWFSARYEAFDDPSLLTADGQLTEIGAAFTAPEYTVHLPAVWG